MWNVKRAILTREVFLMATSSITKNFVISGRKQVEMFADAIEASANDMWLRRKLEEKLN